MRGSDLPWRAAAALVLAALASEPAIGQVYPIRVVTKECAVVGCRLAEARGSAVAIGRHSPGKELLLTAGHCVRGNVTRVEVGIGGAWYAAVVLGSALDGGQDLAVFGVNYSGEPLRCAPVADADAPIGARLLVAGFPGGAGFRSREAAVAQHVYRDVDLVVNVPTLPGESGGGVFNERRELAGIISATGPLPRPEHTLATGAKRIRAFLEKAVGGVPECRPAQPAADEPQPSIDHAARLLAEVEELKVRIAELEKREPLAGLPGPPGERGPPGPAGECDDELGERVAALEEQRIPVQILASDGTVVDEASYRLGEVIRLTLVPKGGRPRIED